MGTDIVHSVVCPSPFTTERTVRDIPAGTTVTEAMDNLAPRGLIYGAHVFLDDKYVERGEWDRTYCQPGQLLTVRVLPMGSGNKGKDILRGTLALAAFVTGTWAAAGGLSWSAVRSGLKWGISTWAASGLIVPTPEPPKVKADEPLYSITGSQNKVNRYGVVPKLYGTMKMFPPLAALPYTEIVGNEQFVNVLYCFGRGKVYLDEDSLKIGDDLLRNYTGSTNDVIYEMGSGFTNDDATATAQTPSMFSNTIYENRLDNELVYDEWMQHQTKTGEDADEISVDVTFPFGLYSLDDDSNKQNRTCGFELEYKKVGESDWLPNTDPSKENLCPSLDEWDLGGTASYSAVDEEITLAAEGDYCESPRIFINGSSEFDFTANYNSTDPSTEYTPQGGRYIEVTYYASHSDYQDTRNDDDETLTTDYAAYDTGGDESDTFAGTGGRYVRYIKIKIISVAPYTAASYKINTPEVVTAYSYSFTHKSSKAQRHSVKFAVPEAGVYDVRLKKTRAETSNGANNMYWTALRTIVHKDPVSDENVALLALRVKATGALSGTVDQFSGIATSVLPVWSGAAWTDTATSNPAWVMTDVLKGSATSTPVLDARIDLTTMLSFATACTVAGYEFNYIIDSAITKREMLKLAASVGRGSFTFNDTKYSVIQDTVKTTPCQHFTPRNSFNFSGSKVFRPDPHAFKIKYINAAADYEEDECIVYDDEYTAANATLFENLTYIGMTDYEQVWKRGRFDMAAARLRPELFSIDTDFEHIICQRGDLIEVTHDVIGWGLQTARIKTVTTSGSERVIAIDDTFTMESGKLYSVNFRYADGTILTGVVGIPIETVVGDNTSVTTKGWNPLFSDPAAGDLIVFGIQNQERQRCLVKEIIPGDDLGASLALVEYNPAVYTADTGTIPDYDSHITVRPNIHRTPPVPVVYQTRSDETVMYRGLDGTYRSRILIDLVRVSDTPADIATITDSANIIPHTLQAEWREYDCDDTWTKLPAVSADTMDVSINDVEDGRAYDIRLRYVSEFGRASAWAAIENYTVVGKSTLPPDVTTINYKQPDRIEWTYTPPLDFRGFEVRFNAGSNTSWETGTVAHNGWITGTYFNISTFTGGTTTWMVKAIDTAGNYSENAVYIIRDLGDPSSSNIILTWDVDADGYPGELNDCTVATGDLYADEETSLFYGADDSLFYDRPTLFYGSHYLAMRYTFPYIPPAANAGVDFWLDYTDTNMSDIQFRRTELTAGEDFSDDLSGWTNDAGTWAIVSNELLGAYVVPTGGNQTLTWDDYELPVGEKFYIQFKVRNTDVSSGIFGVSFGGQYWLWDNAKHTRTIDGDTAESPAMTDNVSQVWLFEILENDTVNWYVDGNFIDIGTWTGTSSTLRFVLQAYTGDPTGTTYDDLKVFKPDGSFVLWTGKVTTAADELYELRFNSLSGTSRGVISDLAVKLDVDDIIEYQEDVAISSGGTRLTLVNTFTAITNITATIQASGVEAAIGVVINDKQVTAGAGNGPEIECYDAAGASCDGHVDLKIRGYYSG